MVYKSLFIFIFLSFSFSYNARYGGELYKDSKNARNTALGGISLSYADGSNPLNLKDQQRSSIHFSHKNKSDCQGETLAHLKAKDIIAENKHLYLPDALNKYHKVYFDKVEVEKLINDSKYRADLICYSKERKFVVEIVVTSDISEEKTKRQNKKGKYRKMGLNHSEREKKI